MDRSWQARVTAIVAVLSVSALAWVPSEHIHESVHDGRTAEVVHRHFESHQAAPEGVHLEQHDGDPHYLTPGLSTPEPSHRVLPDTQVAYLAHLYHPTVVRVGRAQTGDLVTAHGPPWRESFQLRGPPSLS